MFCVEGSCRPGNATRGPSNPLRFVRARDSGGSTPSGRTTGSGFAGRAGLDACAGDFAAAAGAFGACFASLFLGAAMLFTAVFAAGGFVAVSCTVTFAVFLTGLFATLSTDLPAGLVAIVERVFPDMVLFDATFFFATLFFVTFFTGFFTTFFTGLRTVFFRAATARFAPARRFTRADEERARDGFPDDARRRVLDLRGVAMG